MAIPTVTEVTIYLAGIDPQQAVETSAVSAAYAAEKAAQANRCRVPADAEDWPADLAEALCRRVARNLAARPLTLGFVPSVDPNAGASYLSSNDPEIRRLEGPYRKLVIG